MNTIDVSLDKYYADATKEHIKSLREELQELRVIVETRNLNKFEYRALERNLQLLVEVAIGLSKRVLKSSKLEVPSDSRKSFEKLKMYQLDESKVDWNKAIGLRNALVHDYLEINKEIIVSVLKDDYYLEIFQFAEQYLTTKE